MHSTHGVLLLSLAVVLKVDGNEVRRHETGNGVNVRLLALRS